jgi:hypothetical protein
VAGTICTSKLLNQSHERKFVMKNHLVLLASSFNKIDRQHIQLAFVILSLAMLVIGVGAPTDGGGVGR